MRASEIIRPTVHLILRKHPSDHGITPPSHDHADLFPLYRRWIYRLRRQDVDYDDVRQEKGYSGFNG